MVCYDKKTWVTVCTYNLVESQSDFTDYTCMCFQLLVFCRTFEPLWGVLRVATEKLANAHMQVVQKFQDLIKELKEYGDKQKERHKQVSGFVRLL